MILVLVMAGALWGIGAAMGAPRRARWTMLAILMAGVLLVQLLLPAGHPLRTATGGSAALWLLLLAFTGLAWAYGRGLRAVRAKARGRVEETAPPAEGDGPFAPGELRRYARHVVLREIGGPGQAALKRARVLVVGAGGLGAPALQYLVAAGVGTVGLIDDDAVSESNLQRQVIFRTDQVGMPKVFAAEAVLSALNPHTVLRPYHRRLTQEIAAELFADYDLILDGSDNFDTRYLVNRAAVAARLPLVAAALTQWEGQLSVWDPARGAPCFACVFPQAPDPALVPSCAEAGVLGPLPGVMGAMMAAEAIKVLGGAGTPLRGRLAIHDMLYGDSRVIGVKRRADCPVCGGGR